MQDDDPDLDRAYALKTPQDSVQLYRDWADSYDKDFATRMDYVYPGVIAAELAQRLGPDDSPILDVGAGTGLVGAALSEGVKRQIDALDISAEMLDQAMSKGCYRQAIKADLTQSLPIDTGQYGALVRAGTFTHGHVGPEALDELLRIAKPRALFVLGINQAVYDAMGFAEKFQTLSPLMSGFQLVERPIYGPNAPADHKDDRATIAVFRKSA
jgi:ubiquinone/menaquinone biosynthesis C-methylase UbiE